MRESQAKFAIGELVWHKLFDYRGVIIDVDPIFLGEDAWYEQVARSRPPKDRPWYHVLVDNASHATYVAERNLANDESLQPIRHPDIQQFFSEFRDGIYVSRQQAN